ncbi:MAG: acyl-ACP--UDP-N-acetylglucosamine O-acyltransferase [Phycisphaerae bacterium]|nr:acyl-ACP--UDP-N-acetylglucosamine O-acyltransferase [Phycisphaerae bacterium]
MIDTPASIHPTAIVDSGARLGREVAIGAHCYVGAQVELGDGCRLYNHVTIDGHTTLGPGCTVFPGAVLGMPPQDLKYRGGDVRLEIGARNTIREMVTIHPGTENGGGITRVGDDNHLLIGVHVAHDCQVGSRCVFANYVQLGGHVLVEDYVTFGGQSGVHHFVTIGRHAMVGGLTRVATDVPPFMVFVGARTHARVRMVNGVGLQRRGFTNEQIAALKKAYMRLYSRRARSSGRSLLDNVEKLLAENHADPNVQYLGRFLIRSFAHGRNGRYLESLRHDKPTGT